jgi:hypothetical protein
MSQQVNGFILPVFPVVDGRQFVPDVVIHASEDELDWWEPPSPSVVAPQEVEAAEAAAPVVEGDRDEVQAPPKLPRVQPWRTSPLRYWPQSLLRPSGLGPLGSSRLPLLHPPAGRWLVHLRHSRQSGWLWLVAVGGSTLLLCRQGRKFVDGGWSLLLPRTLPPCRLRQPGYHRGPGFTPGSRWCGDASPARPTHSPRSGCCPP